MSRRGFTIIELLVVIAIIAMLAGLSASAFMAARRNHQLAAVAGEIQGILRAARNTSISSGTPSYVVINPKTREVWAQSFATAGEWSFETDDPGISLHEAELVDGRIGRGVSIAGGAGHVNCGVKPVFDLRAGVVIEAWIRHGRSKSVRPPAAVRAKRKPKLKRSGGSNRGALSFVVLEKEGSYGLEMTENGALVGTIGEYVVSTEDDIIPPNRWVFVALRYDGREIVLNADGVDRDVWELGGGSRFLRSEEGGLPPEIPVTESALTISSPVAPFPGQIDEVRLRGRVDTLEYEYPAYLRVVGWKKIIHFDRRGHLDAAFHDDEIRFVIVELEDAKLEAAVDEADPSSKSRRKPVEGAADFSMTFDEWLDTFDPDKAAEFDQAEEEAAILRRAYANAKQVVIEIDRLGVVK